jgi:hypothetical protein
MVFTVAICAVRPTLELTRAERAAFYLISKDNDERHAIEASG